MTWRAGVVQKSNQGRCHEFEGGGVNALEVKEVNTVKKLKFEKGGVCMTPPPSSYRGAAPGLLQSPYSLCMKWKGAIKLVFVLLIINKLEGGGPGGVLNTRARSYL